MIFVIYTVFLLFMLYILFMLYFFRISDVYLLIILLYVCDFMLYLSYFCMFLLFLCYFVISAFFSLSSFSFLLYFCHFWDGSCSVMERLTAVDFLTLVSLCLFNMFFERFSVLFPVLIFLLVSFFILSLFL